MASGFAGADDHLNMIQATIDNAIDFARSQLNKGKSLTHCDDCGEPIPERRRAVVTGCRYCITCQQGHDRVIASTYNRRGSKDSQLR